MALTPPDNGLNTPEAAKYLAAEARMQALMDGKIIEPPTTPIYNPPSYTEQPTVVVEKKAELSKEERRAEALKTLGLVASESTVEFIYEPEGHEPFSVSIRPLALTITEDNISLLVPPYLSVRPPKLIQFSLKVDAVIHKVVSVGTILKLEDMQVLSFVRVN